MATFITRHASSNFAINIYIFPHASMLLCFNNFNFTWKFYLIIIINIYLCLCVLGPTGDGITLFSSYMFMRIGHRPSYYLKYHDMEKGLGPCSCILWTCKDGPTSDLNNLANSFHFSSNNGFKSHCNLVWTIVFFLIVSR